MKKIIYALLLVVFATAACACSGNEENNLPVTPPSGGDVAALHVINHNIFFDLKPGNAGGENNSDNNSLTAAHVKHQDPRFTDIAECDLHLQAALPAINKAVAITLPGSETLMFGTDFDGKQRQPGQ